MAATVADGAATARSPQVATPLNSEEMLSAMCMFVMTLLLIVAFFKACGREIDTAIRVTIRRATPQTADHVFESVLRERIENRLNRREADKLRKRRVRQLLMGPTT